MPGTSLARPSGDHKTETWKLEGDTWVFYTEHPDAAKAAGKAGLREMGAYYRSIGGGRAEFFAWQFAGPKEKVLAVARKFGAAPPEGREKKRVTPAERPMLSLRTCPGCQKQFEPDSPRQKYCWRCGTLMRGSGVTAKGGRLVDGHAGEKLPLVRRPF